jgi:hypothetical protein
VEIFFKISDRGSSGGNKKLRNVIIKLLKCSSIYQPGQLITILIEEQMFHEYGFNFDGLDVWMRG